MKLEERDDKIETLARTTDRTYDSIAAEFSITKERVRQILKARGYERGPRTGADHPDWKGDRWETEDGEVMVRRPDHPRAGEYGAIPEHIVVAEEKIERYLRPGERVWHIDRDTTNNDPDNLRVVSHKEWHTLRGAQTRVYESQDLLTFLRWLALKLGHTPRQKDVYETGGVSPMVYRSRWGSTREAQEAAGLVPTPPAGRPAPPPEGFEERYGHLLDEYDTAEEILDG